MIASCRGGAIALALVFLWPMLAHGEPAMRCERFTEAQLPAPAPQLGDYARKRVEAINAAVKSEPYRALFFGDSLVENFAIGVGAGAWREQMAPRGVLDAGISADRTENLLWRLDHGNLDGPPPDAVVLLIGTNDLSAGRSPNETAAGVRAVLLNLRERLPQARILLLGLWPRGEAADSPFRAKLGEVNRQIETCADGGSLVYADIGGALLDADGGLPSALASDRLHPSAAGYQRLAPPLGRLIDLLLPRE